MEPRRQSDQVSREEGLAWCVVHRSEQNPKEHLGSPFVPRVAFSLLQATLLHSFSSRFLEAWDFAHRR